MNDVITIGVDLAKSVFQIHGVDAEGAVVFRRRLRRGQVLPFFKKQPPAWLAWKPATHYREKHPSPTGRAHRTSV